MSSIFDSVLSLAPYHLLSYGTLLGTELYQVCGFNEYSSAHHRPNALLA